MTDVEAATELVRSRYADHRPAFYGDREAFRLELASTSVASGAGWFHVDRIRHTMGVRAPTDPATDLLLAVPVGAGNLRHTAGRETSSSVCLIPYWRPCLTEWDDLDAVVGVLDLAGVRRVGAEISGLDPGAVEFTDWRPISPAWGDMVVATLNHLGRHVLPLEEAAGSPLLLSEAFRHLAVTLLAAFPNTTHTRAPVGGDQGGPATLRRAMAFMDDHAEEDIDVSQVAEAARLGARGLQIAFRRHRGQTPLEYLRAVRLERAHGDLQAGDPTAGDTVRAIAARWGFRNQGRFSVEYRRVYGRSPSLTLRE